MMRSEDPLGARLVPTTPRSRAGFWQILQPGPSCSFLGSPCLSFPQCREDLTLRASCSKTLCCHSGRDATQGGSVKCLVWLIFFFLPTELKELPGGASHYISETTPLQALHGANKKPLPFILLFFFPSCLALPQPCERSSES